MVETRWNGWDIPKDVQQEVSYLIGLLYRTTNIENRQGIDKEINDLILWAHNEDRSGHNSTRTSQFTYDATPTDLSRREAIRAQRERRE